MAVLLYGLDLSHHVVKVRRILAYKGIAHDYEYAPIHDRQDLLAVSGQDYVPYLLWEDKGVTWPEIADFLEAKRPTPTLYPDGQRHLARILESWAHDVVEEMAWRIAAPGARKTFADPREAWVFEELQMRKRGDLDELAAQKPKHEKALVATLKDVEARLGESPYLLGREPSVADFALYGALHCLPYTGNEIPRALPHVRAWFGAVAALGAGGSGGA
ncbi:MAG TPA: glutathione S-transferase family protein [Candidatus Thermoplasmatota archaeon]|nr:glutathione S-transferase family protein [Candidatus Thermoplasmatota archaeon]